MAVGPSGPALRPGEEEWREAFDRLRDRFPSVPAHRVAQALREHDGHAGGAARMLRDLTSSVVKEADPDDVEHVATLLSSPSMFKHACKEQFRKYDVNGDGVLQWEEVLALVNQLYEEFGLQLPSEGSLKAFFYATDENQDGVLSEREFRKFFEMFLRYAFFDHLKLRKMVEKGQAIEAKRNSMVTGTETANVASTSSRSSRASSKSNSETRHSKASTPEDAGHGHVDTKPMGNSEARRPASGSKLSKTASAPALSPASTGMHHLSPTNAQSRTNAQNQRHRQRDRHSRQPFDQAAAPQMLRCISSNGVAYRSSTNYQDRTDEVISHGSIVQVLETWVRTPEGWLPVVDPQGQTLFERTQTPDSATVKSKKHVSIVRSSRSSGPEERQERKEERHEAALTPEGEIWVRAEPESGGLKSSEEEWRPVFERLCQRFPNISPDRVAKSLRDNDGHAGKAASMLRYM